MVKKYLLIIAGSLSLTIGVIGIFVPLLPTTPFLLLSAVCFLNSSITLYNRLVNNKFFGKYISDYLKYRAVSKKSKVITITLLWVVIIISIIFATQILWIRILLLIVAISVTIHLLLLKTLDLDRIDKREL